jgi:hypothetical protein
MTDIVWVSRAFGDTELLKDFHRDRALLNALGEMTVMEKVQLGFVLGSDDFADKIYRDDSSRPFRKLPDIFNGGGYWIVSSDAASILKEFNLGEGGLFPIALFEEDETTPIAGEYFCLSIGNQKSAFLPEASVGAKQRNIRVGVPGWKPPFVLTDDAFAVSEAALAGPDIWVDTVVGDAFFLSNSLALALKKAKADKGFSLRTCRVIVS